jgi:ubiquinone/menaquinone biosynthesis C-methylase UbiE
MSLQKDPEGSEKKYLRAFADFRNKRVLEVGCGEGRLTWKYAAASRLTVGFDSDHDALRVARADAPLQLENQVHFTCASARNIPLAKETFDIAILSWSL